MNKKLVRAGILRKNGKADKGIGLSVNGGYPSSVSFALTYMWENAWYMAELIWPLALIKIEGN